MSDNLFPPFMVEALRTATASRWTMFCARLFGTKTVEHDGHLQATVHHWRGKAYLTRLSVGQEQQATIADGIYDNTATMRREWWFKGECQGDVSIHLIEAKHPPWLNPKPFGKFPDLPTNPPDPKSAERDPAGQ